MVNSITGNQTIIQFMVSNTTGFLFNSAPGSYLAAGGLFILGLIIGWYIHFQIFEY